MDASQIRKRNRFQQRLQKAKWVIWLAVVALVGYYLYWRSERIETARVVSDEFLTRIGRRELSPIPGRLFTQGLRLDLPDRKFDRQMDLLARKFGGLEEFNLVDRELSWDNDKVRLVYQTSFRRSSSRAIFEIIVDPSGYWKIDTYFFWSDTWKEL